MSGCQYIHRSADEGGTNYCTLVVPHEWEAIRRTVPCPTCDGAQCVTVQAYSDGVPMIEHDCTDCMDGFIDLARLLAVGASVFHMLQWAEILPEQALPPRELLRGLAAVTP